MKTLIPRISTPLLALVFVVLATTSASRKSLTWDEPTFITSGYTYLDRSDFRLNPEAPPLLQELVALPIKHGDFSGPDYAHPGWDKRAQVAFARDHALRNSDRIHDFAFWSRLPITLLGGCLILFGASFCARVAGWQSALVFALLAAVSPNLLAHGRLATTDLGCAALMFAAVAAFWHATDDNRPVTWLLTGTVTGLALLSKFTTLLLGPVFAILGIYEISAGRLSTRSLASGAGYILVAIIALLFIGYDFANGPALYMSGIQAIYSRFTEGYHFYLLGEIYEESVWYYHPVAFLLKTPEPTILLIGIAIWAIIRRPELRRPAVYLLTPVVILVFVSMFDKANLGLRRILPIYPFLFALIAISSSAKPCKACQYVYVALVGWAVLASSLAYPHYLSYFNVLSGGIENGPHLLDDSNVDWGQDLPALAEWQSRHPDVPVALRYFGTAEPSLYGVRASRMADVDVVAPDPGVYAISAHNLAHFRKFAIQTNRPDIDWLTQYEPFERLGGSIYLYRFPQ